jgi:hypothetical protein
MYAGENNDFMVPNAKLGAVVSQSWCDPETISWGSTPGNTNVAFYESSLLAPYMGGQLGVYKCPADIIPSDNGDRIRSYSMNSQVGDDDPSTLMEAQSVCLGFRCFSKLSDITICPGPTDTFVFMEESMLTLNDGYFQVWATPPGTIENFYDIPACYHVWGCGTSFADGHGEIHKWQTKYLQRLVPAKTPTLASMTVGNNNADWLWFTQHATCPQ